MATTNGLGKGPVREFVKDAALAAFAATAIDLFVEATNIIPPLNAPSAIPIVDPQATNIESVLYGSALVMGTLGALSVFAGKDIVPGFGKTALATAFGLYTGTQFYETQLVKYLGIRAIRHHPMHPVQPYR